MNHFRLLSIVSLCIFAHNVQAVTLSLDTFTALPGTSVALEPSLAGTVMEDLVTPFSFSAYGGTVSGTVQNRVVHSIDGSYDFYWRVINDANSAGIIQDLRIGNFFTGSYNANYRIDGLGDTSPTQAYLFSNPVGYLNFNFNSPVGAAGGLAPGSGSRFFFLDTDATSYSKTAIYDLSNTGQTQNSGIYETFAPAVPEPETYGMMLMGLGLMGFVTHRRKNSKA